MVPLHTPAPITPANRHIDYQHNATLSIDWVGMYMLAPPAMQIHSLSSLDEHGGYSLVQDFPGHGYKCPTCTFQSMQAGIMVEHLLAHGIVAHVCIIDFHAFCIFTVIHLVGHCGRSTN